MSPDRGPARHEKPAVDEAALVAARNAERALQAARDHASERWERFLEPIPDQLRDASLVDLRGVVLRARSAFGVKDSIRDVLPSDMTEPLLESLDRLLRLLAREAARGDVGPGEAGRGTAGGSNAAARVQRGEDRR